MSLVDEIRGTALMYHLKSFYEYAVFTNYRKVDN
jgi:hypothetical protein